MLKIITIITSIGAALLLIVFKVSMSSCMAQFIVLSMFIVLTIAGFLEYTILRVFSVVAFISSLVIMINSTGEHGLLCYSCLIPFAVAVALIFILRKMWLNEVLEAEAEKDAINEEVNTVESRLENKQMTLMNLEQQVTDIIDLFEVAKDFNECLTVDSVISILRLRVSQYLSYDKAVLVMLNDEHMPQFNYKAYVLSKDEVVMIESNESEYNGEQTEINEFIQACADHKDVIRIDYPIQYEDYFEGDRTSVVYPLWLFPLIVENKLIAVYIVHGGKVNDFPKFSIIASQLALQIKKIKLYEDVKELSITDGLTKFFLRRHFNERFEEEIKRSLKYGHLLCVLMIDVDHFKEYNDKYGHLVGDATLREVANIVRDNTRKVDLTGRYGGEEFILVLPETDKEGGIDAAERIRSAVARKSLKVYDEETKITISVGLSSFPESCDKEYIEFSPKILDILVKEADKNLYQAKQDGRNRVVY